MSTNMRSMLRPVPGLAAIAIIIAILLIGSSMIAATTPVTAQGVEVALDTDISDGPCADIDSDLSVPVGTTFQVALCVEGLETGVAIFSADVTYDDAVILAPEVADEGWGVDDNPDANAGTTIWGESLGEKVDCSLRLMAYPMGDKDPAKGIGDAFINCANLVGPWPLGDNSSSGVLAVITFNAVAEGTSSLALNKVVLGDRDASEIGSCRPDLTYPVPCNGATIHVLKKGEITPSGQATDLASPSSPVASPEASAPDQTSMATGSGEGRDWLLPTVVGTPVVVVGLLSLGFYRWRRRRIR